MSKTRKQSRRARGKKNLTSKQRAEKEIAKEYKKIIRQISSLEKKIPRNEEYMIKLGQKEETNLRKLQGKRLKFQSEVEQKLQQKRRENLDYETQLVDLQAAAQSLKGELTYSGLALL